MGRTRLDTGAVVAAVGAALLLASLFLDWYGDLSGWTAFETLDLVMAAVAVLALLAAAQRLGYPGPVAARGLTPLGGIALVVVVSQLINHPPAGIGASPKVGAWLALGSSLLIVGGGLAGMARISVELVVEREEDGVDTRTVEREAAAEAAAAEPEVERELYRREHGDAPLGADDPEPFGRANGSEEETRRIE